MSQGRRIMRPSRPPGPRDFCDEPRTQDTGACARIAHATVSRRSSRLGSAALRCACRSSLVFLGAIWGIWSATTNDALAQPDLPPPPPPPLESSPTLRRCPHHRRLRPRHRPAPPRGCRPRPPVNPNRGVLPHLLLRGLPPPPPSTLRATIPRTRRHPTCTRRKRRHAPSPSRSTPYPWFGAV